MSVEIKEEPEEIKPVVSTLDKNINTNIWLVRVPQWLANFWGSQEADVNLGTVQIQPHTDTQKNEAFLVLPDTELPCKQFKMKTPPSTASTMKILSEDLQGAVGLEGNVSYKFDLEPLESEKSKLRKSMIQYAASMDVRNKGNALPTLKVLEKAGKRESKMFANNYTGNKRKRDERGVPEKRERTDRDKLVEMIFDCFKEKDFWTFKDLNDRCKQPVAWLKEVLQPYCDYNKKGPNKQLYELKSEYAPHKKPKEEKPDDDDDSE